MLDLSSSHLPDCAVSPVELSRMEEQASGMRATCARVTAGNCHSSGVGTPVRRVPVHTCFYSCENPSREELAGQESSRFFP